MKLDQYDLKEFNQRIKLYEKHQVLILPAEFARQYHPEPGTVLIRLKTEKFGPIIHETQYDEVLKVKVADIEFERDRKSVV